MKLIILTVTRIYFAGNFIRNQDIVIEYISNAIEYLSKRDEIPLQVFFLYP